MTTSQPLTLGFLGGDIHPRMLSGIPSSLNDVVLDRRVKHPLEAGQIHTWDGLD